METRANFLLVGAFVVVMVVSTAWAAIWLLGLNPIARESGYDIYFKGSVAGLKTGAAAYLSGVAVGTVREIQIDPNDFSQVRVHIEVPPDVVVKTDSVAAIDTNILLGNGWIDITGGSEDAPRLSVAPGNPYPIIRSKPSAVADYVEWLPQATERAIKVEDWLIETLSDSNLQKGSNVLDILERVTAPGAQGIDATIGKVDAMLEAAQENASKLAGGLEGSKETLSEAEAKLGRADTFIKEAGKTAHEVDTVVQQNRAEIRDLARTRSVAFEVMIEDARALIAQVTRRIDEIARNPNGILFGGQRDGYQPGAR